MSAHVFSQNFNPTLREEAGKADAAESRYFVNYVPGLLFLLLVLVFFTWGIKHLLDPHTLPIRHVSVKGDFYHLVPVSLEERASNVVRGGFFNVNVETIKEVLSEEPWVRDVTVKRVWPDSITVYIKEQVAVALWQDKGLLNDEAELFSPDVSTFPINLPRFHGPDGTYSLLLDTYRYIERIVPNKLKIKDLILTDRRAWEVKFENGITVLLGRSELENRIKRFAQHVPSELSNRLQDIVSIDMRYTNGFSILWNSDVASDLNNQR